MGRWRPPARASSPYITADGARRLDKELKELWKTRRPEVVRALAAAAAEGDRSENAEYTYRKKQLGEIDRRIRYLSKRLDQVKVVDRPPADTDRVRFGAWVRLAVNGSESRYRIVGADETDAVSGWISVDSPVARALLGKRVGDEVKVALPEGRDVLEILEISYHPRP
jgi:transcription elongation factor GreB